MDINNLYATSSQITVATGIIEKVTAPVSTITQPVSQEAYWLGWIRPENTPSILLHSNCKIDTSADTLIFQHDVVQENFPCGYVYNTRRRGFYYLADGVPTGNVNTEGQTQFYNDLHPEYSAYWSDLRLFLSYYAINDGEIVNKGATDDVHTLEIPFTGSESLGGTLQDYLDFLNGDKTITVTAGYDNNRTYNINMADFENGYAEVISNEDSTRSAMFIITYVFLPSVMYTSRYALYSQFSIKANYVDGENTESYNVSLDYPVTTPAYLAQGTTTITWMNTTTCGLQGDFTYSEVNTLSVYNGYIISGNVFAYARTGSGGSGYRTWFCHIFTPDELYKMLALMYRVDVTGNSTPVFSYVENQTYATDVTSDNEFLAKLKTGNISDDDFRNGLRYWQYTSIVNNGFKEDDVPPYEPPAPPVEGEESGDPINIQIRAIRGATNFITQYAMTATQVAVFGNKLWTSWVDEGSLTDFWQNFWLVATGQTDTGSMDIGAMMQFIVSLQVFPFVIPNTFGSQVNEIKVGRGAVPIDMQTAPNVLRLTTSNIYLGCGTRQIPRPYGDYRDYTNITITAYLPFVGTCELNPADVVGRSLSCYYFIDLYTGGCTAYMMASDDENHVYPVCQMDGSIGASLPVSATNSAQIKAQTISNAMGLATSLAGSYSQHINAGKQAIMGLASGNGEALAMAAESNFNSKLSAASGIANFADTIMTQGGVACPSLSGGKGDLSSFSQPAYPYIQMRYGLYTEPNNYDHSVGTPSTKSSTLSSYSGFTVCNNVDVSQLSCHADEKRAIKEFLETGIYL